MASDFLPDPHNPWDTPPLALDLELVETSQRLVALSDATYCEGSTPSDPSANTTPQDPRLVALENRNKYLFERNVVLVAKVAELEAANLRLQAQVSALRHPQHSDLPWYLRWFKAP